MTQVTKVIHTLVRHRDQQYASICLYTFTQTYIHIICFQCYDTVGRGHPACKLAECRHSGTAGDLTGASHVSSALHHHHLHSSTTLPALESYICFA